MHLLKECLIFGARSSFYSNVRQGVSYTNFSVTYTYFRVFLFLRAKVEAFFFYLGYVQYCSHIGQITSSRLNDLDPSG